MTEGTKDSASASEAGGGVEAPAVDWFLESVRCRASDDSLVPVGLIRRLTPGQWSKIRMMTQGQARKLLAWHARGEVG